MRSTAPVDGLGSTRREFVERAVGILGCLGLTNLTVEQLLAENTAVHWSAHGTRLADLEFQAEPDEPMHQLLHQGLDGRLYTDLSMVTEDRLLTPIDQFYVRTATPDGLASLAVRDVQVGGSVARPTTITADELSSRASDQGRHVIECAGNSRFFRFGLMSSAQFSGVPLGEVLDDARPRPLGSAEAKWVLVSGFDGHSRGSSNSVIGCSWIFPRSEVERAGAFLATEMNGEPLTEIHGAPIRLVVPGWYGCCSIKWVDRIELVDDGQPATSQMQEFALRTHQDAVKEMANEYQPAIVDRAAMPIRIETWRFEQRIKYRVVGLDWGGDRSPGRLAIRFRPQDPYQPVTHQPDPAREITETAWSLWEHTWEPEGPGRYLIQLKVEPASIRTRRLSAGFYARGVEITAASEQA